MQLNEIKKMIMNKNVEKLTYKAAITELEGIIDEMDDMAIGVDELAEKVKRAAFLLQYCKDKLHSTETEVNEVLKIFGKESGEQQEIK